MTPDAFQQLFTREGLGPFQPRPGTQGLTPILEVHRPTAIEVYVLALDGFNDWATRQQIMTELGRRGASVGEVEAVRFGSEAWVRAFTPAEFAARGTRLVETYADKEEIILVMGQMADGFGYRAQARLHRHPNATVSHLGAWEVHSGLTQRSPLLDAFWAGYHAAQA